MHPIVYIFYTGALLNLIPADLTVTSWLDSICQHDMPGVQSASNTKLRVSETTALHVHLREARTRVSYGVVSELVVPVQLETRYMYKFHQVYTLG